MCEQVKRHEHVEIVDNVENVFFLVKREYDPLDTAPIQYEYCGDSRCPTWRSKYGRSCASVHDCPTFHIQLL